jgi:hypothetical protein
MTPIFVPRKSNDWKSSAGTLSLDNQEEDHSEDKSKNSWEMNRGRRKSYTQVVENAPVFLSPYSSSTSNSWLNYRDQNSFRLAEIAKEGAPLTDAEMAVVQSEGVSRKVMHGPSAVFAVADTKKKKVPSALVALGSQTVAGIWSQSRQLQLDECTQIEADFARRGVPFSQNAVERGILAPEDRDELACLANLPVPGSLTPQLPVDPEVPKEEGEGGEGKAKKGGKKKGGKKKGGKKKGKKK